MVLLVFVVQLPAYLGIHLIIVLCFLPHVGVEVVAVQVGFEHVHHLCLAFIAEGRTVEKTLEALAHNGVGDDVVEFLDVAVGGVDVVEWVCFAIFLNHPCAIVEVWSSKGILGEIGETPCLAIGEDVLMQVVVEVFGEITAGHGLDNLVVQS